MALTTAALSAAILAGCGKQGEKTENTAPSGTVQSDNLPVNENGEPDPLGIYQEPVKLKIAQVVNPSDTFPEGQSATKNAFFDYFKENQRITEFPCDIVFHLAHQVIDISIVVIAGSGRDPQPFSQLPQREIPLSFLVNQRQPFFDQLCLQISVMVWFFFHNSAFLKCFILR